MCQITQMCTFVRWRQSTVLSCRPSGDGCQSSTVGDMYRGEQSVDECYITAWNLTKTKRSSSGLAPVFNCPRFSARRSQWEALTFRYLLKPCVCESCLTVSWPLLFTSAVCLADVSIICDRWGQCAGRSQKMQRIQWCIVFVTSRIDYCNSVIFGSSAVYIRPVQNALDAAARHVLHQRKFDHKLLRLLNKTWQSHINDRPL